MFSKINILHLDYKQPGRRIGIADHSPRPSARMRSANAAAKTDDTMPSKKASKLLKDKISAKNQEAEDINRLPDESSSSESEGPDNADIIPTKFVKGAAKSIRSNPSRGVKKEEPVARPSTIDSNGKYIGTARPKPKKKDHSISSVGSSSQKSSHGEATKRNADSEIFSESKSRPHKVAKTYGSSQSRPASSQVKTPKRESIYGNSSTKREYQKHTIDDIPDTPEPSPRKGFQPPKLDDDFFSGDEAKESRKTSKKKNGKTPITKEVKTKPKFRMPDLDGMEDAMSEPPSSMPLIVDPGTNVPESPPVAAKPTFQLHALDDDALIEVAKAKISSTNDNDIARDIDYDSDHELEFTMTQIGRCPMCNKPVDPAHLREFGVMNIRRQARFCQSHQKKTAQDEWKEAGYPKINWARLDQRITEHHDLIKDLIEGEESHYRDQLEKKIKAGKDRSARKMTSNLTPGYYGTRGLRIISENIMHNFTALLKRQMVEDHIMSARGVSFYVQAVLVPEVASRLVMEDMKVDIEEAREILQDSVEIGELLNEEIKDMVMTTAATDSEHDDDSD